MPAVDVRRWTRKEYERMIRAGIFAPEERVELIDGEILHVYPQDSLHATGVSLALKALTVAFRKGFEVRPRLSLALDPRSQPEPDIAVVRGSARDYRDHHPNSSGRVFSVGLGSPDQTRWSKLDCKNWSAYETVPVTGVCWLPCRLPDDAPVVLFAAASWRFGGFARQRDRGLACGPRERRGTRCLRSAAPA
ncbi:MAG: hypothetical protein DMG07_06515 [Acidobacteria bacterium]|nr:MAG: hypothetical protein DMG07_06515 [Acidobacteriota bacterium]